jgi:hypothetical protein
MAENPRAGNTHEAKGVMRAEISSEESLVNEIRQSTWQLILESKITALWSAFMGLAAIDWGLDVL